MIEPATTSTGERWQPRIGCGSADAVHLATAVNAGATRFLTNNSRDFPKSITEVDITYPLDLPTPI